jgi:hypothetical protein
MAHAAQLAGEAASDVPSADQTYVHFSSNQIVNGCCPDLPAPPETVFDVIAGPYLGQTPHAMADELRVLE